MTSPPPPDSHPTGPPSGPLAGPSSGPGSGSAAEPTRAGAPPTEVDRPRGPGGGGPGDGGSGGGGGGGGGGSGRAGGGPAGGAPWWRSTPRIAIIAAALVAAVALTVVLTRPSGGAGEVFLQPAAAAGPDPFTKSTAKKSAPPPSPTPSPGSATGNPTLRGSDPGLYGGSRNAASCDVEQQIAYLENDQAKAKAFADAAGIDVGALPSFLRSLTPVQLLRDTRVTNHGFKDGKATPFQSVLQAGTAVLVDSHGLPRVRCACGNPLRPPTALRSDAKPVGTAWPGYRASNTVAVRASSTEVKAFVLYDPETGEYFRRPEGSEGSSDTWSPPPTKASPTAPPSTTESSSSESSEPPSTTESSSSESSPPPESSSTGTSGPTGETPTTESQPPPASTGGESGQVSP
ncbi:DUF6777 domain-containing protein [Streptomyces sp. NPDC048483]|uniref:DUF6777 domain-containing protein n=1 Tax=Streptomyces sp. NPDC048483 TaxID=3154927 RepID=UPI0034129C1C